jgi:hypothetical protein
VVSFRVTTTARTSTARAWSVLTDWQAHARWVPFTAVQTSPASDGGTGPGSGFVATTRLGPFRLIDRMVVVEWSPPSTRSGGPGRCEVRKLGPHLHGGAVIEVWPLPGGRTRVDWHEEARPASAVLARIDTVVGGLAVPPGRAVFARALRRAVAEMEAR